MFFSLLSLYSFNDWQFTIRSEFAEREQEKKERWKKGRKERRKEGRKEERSNKEITSSLHKSSLGQMGKKDL